MINRIAVLILVGFSAITVAEAQISPFNEGNLENLEANITGMEIPPKNLYSKLKRFQNLMLQAYLSNPTLTSFYRDFVWKDEYFLPTELSEAGWILVDEDEAITFVLLGLGSHGCDKTQNLNKEIISAPIRGNASYLNYPGKGVFELTYDESDNENVSFAVIMSQLTLEHKDQIGRKFRFSITRKIYYEPDKNGIFFWDEKLPQQIYFRDSDGVRKNYSTLNHSLRTKGSNDR